MRWRGRLDVASLGRAIDDLRVRHESLRTVLEHGDHGLQQRILAPSELPPALTPGTTRLQSRGGAVAPCYAFHALRSESRVAPVDAPLCGRRLVGHATY